MHDRLHLFPAPLRRWSRREAGIALLLGALWSVAGSARGAQRTLDGSRFRGAAGELGQPAEYDEIVRFENGIFYSSVCQDFGFAPAPYTETADGGVRRFHALLQSVEDGRIEWLGHVDGDRLSARFRWRKNRWWRDIDRMHWFDGLRQG